MPPLKKEKAEKKAAKQQHPATSQQTTTAIQHGPAPSQQNTTAPPDPRRRIRGRDTAAADAPDNSFLDLDNLDWITEGFWGLPPDYRGETTETDSNARRRQERPIRPVRDAFNWHHGPGKSEHPNNEDYVRDAAMHVLREKNKKDLTAKAWYEKQMAELSHKDYYTILEVEQTAPPHLIVSSYRRLALKLHPDRNARHDATEAFQLLGLAYETLKDESKRRDYDLIYPSITRRRPPPQNTQTPRPPPGATPQPETLNEAAQIVALQKSKQERGARWRAKKYAFDSTIFDLQRGVRLLEQEIRNLDSILAAEAAAEARKNSWGSWLLSPIYKKAEDSEEEKARKDRGRQERRIEKDLKERRLDLKKADLKKEENLLKKAKEEVDAADLCDDGKIRVIQARIWARTQVAALQPRINNSYARKLLSEHQLETQERQERERVERERLAEIRKQQQEQWEKKLREEAEAMRKQQAERRAAEQKRQEEWRAAEQKRQEEIRKLAKIYDEETRRHREQYTHLNPPKGSTRQAYTSTCDHDGWWPKVQGRTACPECYELWTYLLQCPGCEMMACPRCQAAIRPRKPRNSTRTNRRAPPRVRTPSPDVNYGYDYDW
ncbi:DnaJ-domain-containing protein [Mytilinidion resinicola]|uniref:DnaJ-domain-containing protein n=1 Tax=Mytilinidion resinicola TaxID=574789 RepID=A0A6A6Z5N9_9PEZI|nr:DnaJ-domain-containing protein [Mytilinidion resinicola]KAF2816422.1 DnaJ-domain-containing protein [Mytilinidion resinicola]